MPSVDQKPVEFPRALRELFQTPADADLLREVQCLRQEIAELRSLLLPKSSVILTGQRAIEEYESLLHKTAGY